jgi:hypothetical protein
MRKKNIQNSSKILNRTSIFNYLINVKGGRSFPTFTKQELRGEQAMEGDQPTQREDTLEEEVLTVLTRSQWGTEEQRGTETNGDEGETSAAKK